MKLCRCTRYISLCFPSIDMGDVWAHVVWGCQLTRGDLATDHQPVIHWSVGLKCAWELLPFTLSIRLSTNWIKLTSKVTNHSKPFGLFLWFGNWWVRKEIQAKILQHYLQGIASIRANNEANKVSMLKNLQIPFPLPGDTPVVHAKVDCVGRDRRS